MSFAEHYKKLETEFATLESDFERIFTKTELDQIYEFVDANEFGLALETVIGIIREENKLISDRLAKQLCVLGKSMEMDVDDIMNLLAPNINQQ